MVSIPGGNRLPLLHGLDQCFLRFSWQGWAGRSVWPAVMHRNQLPGRVMKSTARNVAARCGLSACSRSRSARWLNIHSPISTADSRHARSIHSEFFDVSRRERAQRVRSTSDFKPVSLQLTASRFSVRLHTVVSNGSDATCDSTSSHHWSKACCLTGCWESVSQELPASKLQRAS